MIFALARIARAAVAPFWDDELAIRNAEAEQAGEAEALRSIEQQLGTGEVERLQLEATDRLELMRALQANLEEHCTIDPDRFELPPFDRPVPQLPDLERPVPLYDSAVPWAEATMKLRDDKTRAG